MPEGVTLAVAHNQWANRPADERFQTIYQVIDYLKMRTENSSEIREIPFAALEVAQNNGSLILVGPESTAYDLNYHSFGQLAQLCGAPGGWLRDHSAKDGGLDSVESILNIGIQDRIKRVASGEEKDDCANILLGRSARAIGTDGAIVRSINTKRYSRIWDIELAEWFKRMFEVHGFTNPVAYPVGGSFGGDMVPSGLYAGERDSFFFGTNEAKKFEIGGQEFYPGICAWNSEVGTRGIGMVTFLCERVCGNHYIWGARDILEVMMRHVGKASERFKEGFFNAIEAFVSADTLVERKAIEIAMRTCVAADGEGAITFLTEKKLAKKDAKTVVATIEQADTSKIGAISQDPTNLFNLAAGVSWVSQTTKNADERTEMDRVAGKLLAFAAAKGE